jgi:hypothetical protein
MFRNVRLAVYLFLLLFTVLLAGEGSDSLALPRQNVPTIAFQTEEIGKAEHRILTEHYDITAAQLEEGKRIGEQLEHLVHVWKWLRKEFMKNTEEEPVLQRHRVILYRDKQEYTFHLFHIDPSIAQTNGFYDPRRKTAYFFSAEAKILFHEGTHQILAERFFDKKMPVFRNNFWVIEGIALFMETLKVEDQSYRVGDILANRLYSAKKYRFEHGYKLPVQQLTAMNRRDIQWSADLQRIYSQSATLVHWLMFAEEGRYREALFELLRQTYEGSAVPGTLSQLTGLSYEELDKKYEEFLKTIPD